MYTFILSISIVSFIALCFFKKKFWENRYLVLLISAGVAIIATLSINYFTRNKLGTYSKKIWEHKIVTIKFNPNLTDTTFFSKDKNLSLSEHYFDDDDTTINPLKSHYLYYYDDGKLKIGFQVENKRKYRYWDDIYILPSKDENIAYFTKERQYYDKRSSKWTADMSLPHIKTIKCLYLPPHEYAQIPDSLIQQKPF